LRTDSQSYDDRSRQHQLRLWDFIGPALERIGWSDEQLRALREERLRGLLQRLRERSPWHARRLHGIDPAVADEADLSELPPMTKADLMANWDEIVTDPRLSLARCEVHLDRVSETGVPAYLDQEFHVVASGGSSGRRGVFVYGWDDWAHFYAGYSRWILRGLSLRGRPFDPGMSSGWVAARALTHASSAVVRTFLGSAAGGGEGGSFPVSLPLAEIVEGLNRRQPDILFAYSSALGLLAAEATAGRLRIRPIWVWAGAEPLLPDVAEAAERAWGRPVVNLYGTSDVGFMGSGCGVAPGIHLNEDMLIVEPVDREGRPVAPGACAAKAYVTPLLQSTLPVLRYELTDEVALLDEPCPCGSGMRRIADVQGRLDDCFQYAGGVSVHPHVFRSPLSREPGVLEYQVRQTGRGASILVRSAQAFDEAALLREIESGLRGVGLSNPDVSICVVTEIERVGMGKLKRFVPLQ
jgi:phenylacetate-coenzyme A ligase PaaK-like adenylate-forming protein